MDSTENSRAASENSRADHHDRYYTPADAAKVLGLTETRVRHLARSGRLEAERTETGLLLLRASVHSFRDDIRAHQHESPLEASESFVSSREKPAVPVDEPDVIPSLVDPDCECVKGPPGANLNTPPPGGVRTGRVLCPEGYLPRRRRRATYQLRGKEVDTNRPPEPNPEPPPEFLGGRPWVGRGE